MRASLHGEWVSPFARGLIRSGLVDQVPAVVPRAGGGQPFSFGAARAGVSNRKISSFLNANCRFSASASAGVSPARALVPGLHVFTALPSHRCAFLTHYTR